MSAYSFGGGQGQALINQRKKRPRSTPPTVTGPGSSPRQPGAPQVDSISAEADRIIAEMLASLGIARDTARREAEQSAQTEINRAKALSEALTALGMPGLIQGAYSNAAGSIGNLAQGFSGQFSGLAGQQAAEMTNLLGGNATGVRNEGAGMGDVLYGVGGFIPARGLEQTGAAFASQAALEPGFALQFGQLAAAEQMKRYMDEVVPEFTTKEAEIRTQRPAIVSELKSKQEEEKARKRDEAKDLYSAGLITTREFAKRMGVKDWRKFPNRVPTEEAERPKASASLSKAVGYLVDEFGNYIPGKGGKPIPLPKEPEKMDRFGSASAGYWAVTPDGKIVNLIPPVPRAPRAAKGMQVKQLRDGRVVGFDPNTGKTWEVLPPSPQRATGGGGGGRGSQLSANARAEYRAEALELAAIMLSGDAERGLRPLGLADALEALKDAPIPWSIGKKVIIDYYKRHFVGPIPPGATGKGRPARGGKPIRVPTSWRSTHPTDNLAGFDGAIDIMGSPGSPVLAPSSGRIVRHGSAQGGQSLYFQTDDGWTYWLGHIDGMLPIGTRVRRGQRIAYVSADHPRPHVHVDKTRTQYA